MAHAALPIPVGVRPASAADQRVLFALNQAEREAFFPDGVGDALGTEIRWRPDDTASPESWTALCEEYRPTVLVSCWSTAPLPAALLAEDSPLRYVCHLVGSARNLVPRAFLERGGLLSNWGSLAGDNVAEHALLLALAALRSQSAWAPLIHAPQPKPWRSGTMRLRTRTLIGRRVGIHGFGHVARALVRMLRAFDVEIRAYSAGVPDRLMREAGVVPCSSLVELASASEVFFGCEALNAHTRGSVGDAVFAALPDGAVFVNVGRGLVVDEAALLRAAADGRIQVALDVVSQEPLRPDNPLLRLPGAIFSPHIAGPTYDRFADCGLHALENLRRHLRGEPIESRVTLELYDRAT